MPPTANWNYPTAVRFGPGRINELAQACQSLGIQHPLLVTDPGLAENEIVGAAVHQLTQAGLGAGLFSGIKANPTGKNVKDGVTAFNHGQHDGVIALGGGSGLDAGNAIALMAGQTCSLWDLEDVGDNWLRADPKAIAPIVAVPTTAGTGSEVGRASVITDTEAEVKRIIFHPSIVPSVVIADPELTVGLPTGLTAATGMDALAHNLEAFCAPGYHPMARGIAVEGIGLVKRWLPTAVEDGTDLEARGNMLVASMMGATAFQRGLGAMHALAHPLGALYDAHHGLLNAVLMPYVLQANWHAIESELDYLSRALALDGAESILAWILELRARIGIPGNLGALNIDDAQADKVATMATEDPSAASNPIPLSQVQYRTVFTRAVKGEL